jgi:solute carrier family 25 aspartate/glutamate transporter 12/13
MIDGLIAGWIGAFCVYPIDFIKTHVQNGKSLQNIFTNIKPTSLYRGSTIQLIGVGPEKAIKLYVNKLALDNNIHPIVSGGIAGMCQVLVTNPIEYVKIQYQLSKQINIKEINLKNLYKGVFPCLARDIPFSAIYFPTYSYLKESGNSTFVSGLVAGIPSAYLVTPFDVIKTRIQSNLPLPNKFVDYWKGGKWRIAKSAPQFGITLWIYELFNK